ncbi:hypothetical protein HXX76_002885 [Chlamydomonas incerta]|uniref:Fatty acyl-CoA reductase n=1 Tax=Chlamydomonas incerta TaxID=51695 RepID=A0A835TPE0_CHLIN|nr:hypothetical protein HXX76_002885 [Chlamydomonas incerta]|eukprot:KAG2442806.1 hypothetical protein HXX76_002885 [Chlamydomonas incerta]
MSSWLSIPPSAGGGAPELQQQPAPGSGGGAVAGQPQATTPAAEGALPQRTPSSSASSAAAEPAARTPSSDPRVGGNGATAPDAGSSKPQLSLIESLRGRAVFITGATGYLGGVVLEQLLRVAGGSVGPIYVLARSKGRLGAAERVGRVLGSGLFTAVREQHAEALRKVVAVAGDLSESGCGISEAALAELAAEPSLLVIHSAARIALEDPIQTTLLNNYEGTRRLLGLVAGRLSANCAGFVHVSTSFVGMNQPHNSVVPERLCPLMFGDQRVDHVRLARELLGTDKAMADMRAEMLCRNWGLPNTYLLGKHLSESLVEQYHSERLIPAGCAIVRPSLVSALAGAPWPGYVGNLAGPSGYMTAFALGFFNDGSAAWHAWHLLDSVPGDVAGAVILGAAAALAAGIHSREQLHVLAARAAAASSRAPSPAGGAAAVVAATAAMSEHPGGSFLEGGNESFQLRYDVRGGGGFGGALRTLTNVAAAPAAPDAAAGSEGGAAFPGGPAAEDVGDHWNRRALQAQAALDAAAAGEEGRREAPAARRAAGELLVFHAATSTVNPCLHWEAYEMARRFFTVHKPKYRLGGYVKADAKYTPVPWRVTLAKRITKAKVTAAAGLLGCFGQQRAARKLRVGFTAWDYANDVKHDKTLFFSVRNVLALERCVPPEERAALPLVWRGSWEAYANTYMAGVCKLFMGLPVPPSTPQLPHAFVYRPFVHLRPDQLPRVAGEAAAGASGAAGGAAAAVPAAAAAVPAAAGAAAAAPLSVEQPRAAAAGGGADAANGGGAQAAAPSSPGGGGGKKGGGGGRLAELPRPWTIGKVLGGGHKHGKQEAAGKGAGEEQHGQQQGPALVKAAGAVAPPPAGPAQALPAQVV